MCCGAESDGEMPKVGAVADVGRDLPRKTNVLPSLLRILFRNQDLSEVKEYLQRQWTKILAGRVSLQDFIIAKEVKLGSYR